MMGDDSARFSPYDGAGAAMVPYEGGKGKGKRDEVPMELIVRGLVESGGLPGGNGRDGNSGIEVYIHGLPSDCTDLHLYKVFSPFGQISPKGLKVMCDKDTGACIGYGFKFPVDRLRSAGDPDFEWR